MSSLPSRKIKVLLKTRIFNESPKVHYLEDEESNVLVFHTWHDADLARTIWLSEYAGNYQDADATIIEV